MDDEIINNLRNNKGDYNSMVSIAALYKKLYGDFPKIGMSGQQAEFAQSLVDRLPPAAPTRIEEEKAK